MSASKTRLLPPVWRRSISKKYAKNLSDAEVQWKAQAKKIKKGEQQAMLSMLEERGFVNQVAG